jgi:hypothetical protein
MAINRLWGAASAARGTAEAEAVTMGSSKLVHTFEVGQRAFKRMDGGR